MERTIAILEETAASNRLAFDPHKNSRLLFQRNSTAHIKTLGVKISANLDFRPHIDESVSKATAALKVLTRLAKRNGGLDPKALRSIYTGRIRAIVTYGCELWNHNSLTTSKLAEPLVRLHYNALRRITKAYHGSSHQKLGYITNIEPIQVILDHSSITWAARNIKGGDPLVKERIANGRFSDGSNPHFLGRTIIEEAFHKTNQSLEQLSFGDREDTTETTNVHTLTLFDPLEADSKIPAYWRIQLAKIHRDGFNLVYTDGTGRGNHASAGTYSNTGSYGAYLGPYSTVTDAELKAIAIALDKHAPANNITICADSRAALAATLGLSKGAPCRSGIERELKRTLQRLEATGVDVYLLWVRAHIGIEGNEKADRTAYAHSWEGDILNYTPTSTPAGIRQASKAIRQEWRTETSYRNKSFYNSKALAAYTWMRTDKGPQRSWLHKIGKSDSPSCLCGHHTASGEHITFHCPTWDMQRRNLIGERKTWAELDEPIYIQTGPDKEDIIEGGEEWFGHIFGFLA